MVELRTITKDNLEDVLKLDVFDYQKSYVSSIAYSLAQAYVYRDTAFPFAIYTDEILVGFIMMGYYKEKKQYTLWKLLIDRKHQNKGYGKDAAQKGITYLTDTFGAKEIYVGVSSENDRAKRLYTSIGFKATGLIENNMEEMKTNC